MPGFMGLYKQPGTAKHTQGLPFPPCPRWSISLGRSEVRNGCGAEGLGAFPDFLCDLGQVTQRLYPSDLFKN